MVGEVEADWIDAGVDIEDDLIQSNRDQLQLEDARLEDFLAWGRARVEWALRHRNRLRGEKRFAEAKQQFDLEGLLRDYTPKEQKSLLRVADSLSRVPEIGKPRVQEVMRDVVNARSDAIVRSMMESIEDEPELVQDSMWKLVSEFGLIDARRVMSLVEARLATISRLEDAVAHGAREVPDLHNIVRDDSWLIDPRWHLYDDEVEIEKAIPDYEPEKDEDGLQLDFLFLLQPKAPAPLDEVVIVEIKRASRSDGKIHKANHSEISKFQNYVLVAKEYYDRSTLRPRIRGP